MLYAFYLLAAITLISALFVVGSKNPVNSVISLIVCFLSIAGHYILLNAQFLAVVHIIVYTGAIMVLFLFVIMLLNLNKSTEPQKSLTTRIAAVVAGALFLFTLLGAVRQGVNINAAHEFNAGTGLVKSVGKSLFSDFLVPFELSSVLFLAAMVGAMMLGRKENAKGGVSTALDVTGGGKKVSEPEPVQAR